MAARPAITLSSDAERDELAREIRRRIEANLRNESRRQSFERMWATVVLIASVPHSAGSRAHPTTLTLRFDYGELTIHAGRVGRPDVTVSGTAAEILGLSTRRTWITNVGPEVFGGRTHPRLIWRLARLLDDTRDLA
jgi:hypothetical protein